MYENGKMRPVETLPGMWRRRLKENDRGGEFSYDIYCMNLGKCHNVAPEQQ
jgi:hypothetical protein